MESSALPGAPEAVSLETLELMRAGGLLSEEQFEEQKRRLEEEGAWTTCPPCGAVVAASAGSCFNCGDLLAPAIAPKSEPAPARPPRKVPRLFWALWAPFFLVALAAGYFVTSTPTSTSTPTPRSEPTPERTQRPVTFRPAQLLIPPEQFPFSGYYEAGDPVGDPKLSPTWVRGFATLADVDYRFVTISLTVRAPETRYDPMKCPGSELAAPTLGERSVACKEQRPDGSRNIAYQFVSRNVNVTVQLWEVSARMTDSAAIEHALTIGRAQLSLIDRISPP